MPKTQSTYPTTIDSTLQVDRLSGDTITSDSYDVVEDGLFELETKVGVDSSAVATTLDYLLKNAASSNPGHKHTEAGLVITTLSATTFSATTFSGTNVKATELTATTCCATTYYGVALGEGHITILPWNYSSITSGTWTFAMNTAQIFAGTFGCDNAQNNQLNFLVYMAAGTYTFKVCYIRDPSCAILTLLIDAASVGTIDFYGTAAYNQVGSITDISITTSGLKTVSFKNATRNGSATSWYLPTSSAVLFRTA